MRTNRLLAFGLALLFSLNTFAVDFTLAAPGATNSPWSPANVIKPVSNIASQLSPNGWRALTTGTNAAFAHDATYGATITATARILTTSSSDDIILGDIARSGANAGVAIGVCITATTVFTCTANAAGTVTSISTTVANTRAISDVYSVTVVIAAGTATITGNVNGGGNFSFSANTTATNTGEATLAAGAWFLPQNSNGTRLDLFTGTGVSAGTVVNPLSGHGGTAAQPLTLYRRPVDSEGLPIPVWEHAANDAVFRLRATR